MKTDAERQHEYQERQRQSGLIRLHCWAKPDTRQALRDIAEREGKTVGEVLELGMLLARQHFRTVQAPSAPTPARQRPVLITLPRANPISAPPTALAPPSGTPVPADPPERPSSSPEQNEPDNADARIRAAAESAFVVEP